MQELPKSFYDLVGRVRKIDPVAAEWLRHELPKSGEIFSPNAKKLSVLFAWSQSPQGALYWDRIHKRLEKGDGK